MSLFLYNNFKHGIFTFLHSSSPALYVGFRLRSRYFFEFQIQITLTETETLALEMHGLHLLIKIDYLLVTFGITHVIQ